MGHFDRHTRPQKQNQRVGLFGSIRKLDCYITKKQQREVEVCAARALTRKAITGEAGTGHGQQQGERHGFQMVDFQTGDHGHAEAQSLVVRIHEEEEDR